MFCQDMTFQSSLRNFTIEARASWLFVFLLFIFLSEALESIVSFAFVVLSTFIAKSISVLYQAASGPEIGAFIPPEKSA